MKRVVDWNGVSRPVVIAVMGNEALVGMKFLAGHGLWVEVEPGGAVEVRPLPPRPAVPAAAGTPAAGPDPKPSG